MPNYNLYNNNVSHIKNSLDIFISESKNIKKVISFSKDKTSKLNNISADTSARTPSARTPSTTRHHKKKNSESFLHDLSSLDNTRINNLSNYTDNGKSKSKLYS